MIIQDSFSLKKKCVEEELQVFVIFVMKNTHRVIYLKHKKTQMFMIDCEDEE